MVVLSGELPSVKEAWHSMSERLGERTMDLIGHPLCTMPNGVIIRYFYKGTSAPREQLIKPFHQELSIFHTGSLKLGPERKGRRLQSLRTNRNCRHSSKEPLEVATKRAGSGRSQIVLDLSA